MTQFVAVLSILNLILMPTLMIVGIIACITFTRYLLLKIKEVKSK